MMTKTKYLGFALKYSKEKREQKGEYTNQKENIIFVKAPYVGIHYSMFVSKYNHNILLLFH